MALSAAACQPSASPAPARQTLAALLLLLALAATGLALWAGQRQTLLQGPWGLAVLPGGQVWLSVDDALWHLDAQGRRQQVAGLAQTGLPGAPGVLMPHPQGHLVAWVRRESALHLLAAGDARPLGRIALQWPADLARHGRDAIHFALAPDGRVAVATGGGHAVVLFDAQGRYLARSAPDTFRFTNGLWWAGGSWWATDTNRPALVRLADADLKVLQRLPLAGLPGPWHFLGLAGASRGQAIDGQPVLASVARMANDMERARIVDVAAGGAQRAYPPPEEAGFVRPRSLAWLGDSLLAVDGQGFAIRRWNAARQRLPDFGDTTVRAGLAARHDALQRWRLVYRAGLALAAGLLLAALAVLARQRRRQAVAALPHAGGNAAAWRPMLRGQPLPTARQLAVLGLRAAWPVLPILGLAGMQPWLLAHGVRAMQALPPPHFRTAVLALVLLSGLLMAVLMWLALRRRQRLLRTDPAMEPLANQQALRLLARPQGFWPLCQPGEQVRETLMLDAQGLNARWLVLTSQRLLLFRVSGWDTRLLRAVPRGALVQAQCLPLARAPRWMLRLQRWSNPGVYLRLLLADGTVYDGVAVSARAAQHLAARARRLPAAASMAPPLAAPTEGPAAPPGAWRAARRRAARQALASLLVPGAGQWAQRRPGMALVLFVSWLQALLLLGTVAWGAWGGYKEVRPATLALALLPWLLLSVGAAVDAWRMRLHQAVTPPSTAPACSPSASTPAPWR